MATWCTLMCCPRLINQCIAAATQAAFAGGAHAAAGSASPHAESAISADGIQQQAHGRAVLATAQAACARNCDEFAYELLIPPAKQGQPFLCVTSGGRVNKLRIAAASALALPLSAVTATSHRCTRPRPAGRPPRANFTLSFRMCACPAGLADWEVWQAILGDADGAGGVFGAALTAVNADIVSAAHVQTSIAPLPPHPPPRPPPPAPPTVDYYAMDVSARMKVRLGAGSVRRRQLLVEDLGASEACGLLLPVNNITAMRAYAVDFAARYKQGLGLPSDGATTVKVRLG